MMVASRNFGITIDKSKTDALVPFADMLNHFRPRETKWTFDQDTYCFTISTLKKLKAGHQVYDSYGKKCNSRFLLNYGFAVENNCEVRGQNHNEVCQRERERRKHRLRCHTDTPLLVCSLLPNSLSRSLQVRVSFHIKSPAEDPQYGAKMGLLDGSKP